MQDLVRCDDITYQDFDLNAKHFFAVVGPDCGAGDDDDGDDDGELYWRVGPCPISDYRTRTGDLRTVTMSDVVSRRQYHELPIFQEYFRPAGLDDMIDLGLPAAHPHYRSFILFRGAGSCDFSERDRAVLEMLRPHLYRLEAYAALRRQLSDALRAQEGVAESDPYAELTPREREIVELVAEGKTNAQIAVQLWVAPSTVKKHLEHIYAKLGVGSRTAAALRLQHCCALPDSQQPHLYGRCIPIVSSPAGPATKATASAPDWFTAASTNARPRFGPRQPSPHHLMPPSGHSAGVEKRAPDSTQALSLTLLSVRAFSAEPGDAAGNVHPARRRGPRSDHPQTCRRRSRRHSHPVQRST